MSEIRIPIAALIEENPKVLERDAVTDAETLFFGAATLPEGFELLTVDAETLAVTSESTFNSTISHLLRVF